jgi:hypothetical protein
LNGVKKHGNTALFSVTFLLPLPGDFSGNVLPSAVWICIPVLHLVNTCLSGFLFSSGFWMIKLLIFCFFFSMALLLGLEVHLQLGKFDSFPQIDFFASLFREL